MDQLSSHIKTHNPTLYHGSKTSTVIPYNFFDNSDNFDNMELTLADLSSIKPHTKLIENENLLIRGAVSWKMANEFLIPQGRLIKTYPTEDLAQVLSGVATSCTGERSFGFGSLRNQIVSLKYMDYQGELRSLSRDQDIYVTQEGRSFLENYKKDFSIYKFFKNAPFPRFEKQTDLMTGTEGQLGVVTEVVLETAPLEEVKYLFVQLPRWEEDFDSHLEIFTSVQDHRKNLYSCELTDHNSMQALPDKDRLISHSNGFDAIFLEIPSSRFEQFYEEVISNWSLISEESIFEISETKFKQTRAAIPRSLFERNSIKGTLKKGTDVQAQPEKFCDLLNHYRYFAKQGMGYTLFGHFGDAHLHFNFLPEKAQQKTCDDLLEDFYMKVKEWKSSPFAEHGIGLLKQPYIANFYGTSQYDFFSYLKTHHDPHNQFFPQGFMNLKPS